MLVALLGWRTGMHPPAPGLDPSWNSGLAMAVRDGFGFGREIVFSYGPLGFLQSPYIWYGDLGVLAFLFSALVYVCFCVALVLALRRSLPLIASAVIAFLLIGVLPLLEQALLLAVICSLALLAEERSARTRDAFIVLTASFAAIEALVKLSTGPTIVAIFLIALVGARVPLKRILVFLMLLAVEIALLWTLTGQSLEVLPSFLSNTREIVAGYSSAMIREVEVTPWKVTLATIAAGLSALGLVAATGLGGRFRDRRALIAAMLLVALAAFAVFKEGVVRTDAGHLSLYFSAACVLWIAIPWGRTRWRWMVAGAAAIALAGIPVRPPGMSTNLNAVVNVRYAGDQALNLLSSSRRAELIAVGRTGLRTVYRLDPKSRAELTGHTVAIEPWETSVAWAYNLDWQPLPVFQSYSAYTSRLDRLNASAVSEATGPERILRENPPQVYAEFPTQDLDGRYMGWDPPEQERAIFCNFAPQRTSERWQVLARISNRCSAPVAAGVVEASEGHAVKVPTPAKGEVVFVRIHGAGIEGVERISTALFHARARQLVLNGDQGYRLIPETAGDGLLLRGRGPFVETGAFSPIPQAQTIALTGAGDDLRFDFFRMRVRSRSF